MPSYGNDLALVASGTVVTASGSTLGVQVTDKNQFRGQLAVTAASGATPSMTVSVQTSHDNGVADPWRTVGSYAAATAAATSAWQNFVGLDVFVRASWTVSGTTPSFTFGVVGEAV